MSETDNQKITDVIDLSDCEYVTAAEAARIRAMYAEPLTNARLAEIERHRLINQTVAQEPEE